MKLNQKRILFVIIAVLLSVYMVTAQQDESKVAQKKKQKVERTEEREYEKSRKKTLKHLHDIQSKQTLEEMKAVNKKAKQYNSQDKEGFFERIFRRKKYKR